MSNNHHNKQIVLKYVVGNYPTTMQMYFDKFDQKLYDEVYNEYKKKYYHNKHDHKFHYEKEDGDKYYLNFSAFLILDKNQKIKAYAFSEFNDLVWIMKVLSIADLTLSLDEEVYNQIKDELKNHPCLKLVD